MASRDPWVLNEKESLKGKTLWLKPSTIRKIEELKALAKNTDAIFERLRLAIEREVEELGKEAKNRAESSHP